MLPFTNIYLFNTYIWVNIALKRHFRCIWVLQRSQMPEESNEGNYQKGQNLQRKAFSSFSPEKFSLDLNPSPPKKPSITDIQSSLAIEQY